MSENTEGIPNCKKCGNLIRGESRTIDGHALHLNCLPIEEKRELLRSKKSRDFAGNIVGKIIGYGFGALFFILLMSADTLNPFGRDGFICKKLVPYQDTESLRNLYKTLAGSRE